jgi:hypothetical protein
MIHGFRTQRVTELAIAVKLVRNVLRYNISFEKMLKGFI